MIPLSTSDSKKSDDRPGPGGLFGKFQKRISEIILIFNSALIYVVSILTHVSLHYRIPLILIPSLGTLFTYLSPSQRASGRRLLNLIIIPLLVSGAALGALIATAVFVPSVAFSHALLDSVSQVPNVPLTGEASISVVIPARNEDDDLLLKTLEYLFLETPPALLREIIIVDDESEIPLQLMIDANITSPEQRAKIQVIRLNTRQGLTNAKTVGAEASSGSHILFLDGHCRVGPSYAERMLARSLAGSERDIIVPEVIDVEGSTFNFKSIDGGKKMMFEWTFEFAWFDNDVKDDRVPVSSGGILLMTRNEFMNGKYDPGMLEWGGENIEQSLRSWMCGGRVIVERQAKIGHVFQRNLKPGRVNVSTVERNHARAAFVWLDDSLKYFEARHKKGNLFLSDIGPMIDERLELRHRLGCGHFDDFVQTFEPIFEQRNLYIDKEFSIQDIATGLCVTVWQTAPGGKLRDRPVKVQWGICRLYETAQRFGPVGNSTRIRSTKFERCLERKNGELVMVRCRFGKPNDAQDFKFSNGTVHSDIASTTGLRKLGAQCLGSPVAADVKAAVGTPVRYIDCSAAGQAGFNQLYIGL